MNRQLALRIFETFFRRWYLYLIPVVILVGLGVMSVMRSPKDYASTGVVYTNDTTLLSQLTAVRGVNGSFETPAGLVSRQLESALQTDEFVSNVAETSGLGAALETGLTTTDAIRAAISVGPNGNNLVVVRATSPSPQISYELAKATVASYVEWIVQTEIGESSAAAKFFEGLLDTYQTESEAARADLNAYLEQNPEPVLGDRPLAEQVEVDRLTSALNTAEARYADALSKSQDADLATAQTREDVAQRFRLVDEPRVPVAPISGMRARLMSFAVYLFLAGLVLAASVVIGALLDRSVRTPGEVVDRFGIAALAVVPAVRRRMEPRLAVARADEAT